jgi:hypothetical protein
LHKPQSLNLIQEVDSLTGQPDTPLTAQADAALLMTWMHNGEWLESRPQSSLHNWLRVSPHNLPSKTLTSTPKNTLESHPPARKRSPKVGRAPRCTTESLPLGIAGMRSTQAIKGRANFVKLHMQPIIKPAPEAPAYAGASKKREAFKNENICASCKCSL